MAEPMDVDSDPPADSSSPPPRSSIRLSQPALSASDMAILGLNIYIDSMGRRHHEPNEEQRRQYQQMWRNLDEQAAAPDVVQRREILKVTQSYDFQQVQAKVKAKLINLGFLQKRVELAVNAVNRNEDTYSFTEEDVLEEALDILQLNQWAM